MHPDIDPTVATLLLIVATLVLLSGTVSTYLARLLDDTKAALRAAEAHRRVDLDALEQLARELPSEHERLTVQQFVQVRRASR